MTIIRLKDLAKGFQTILLETNYKGWRTYKSLKVKFKKNPSTLQEKFEKKEAQAFAKQVACKIDYALLRDEFDIDEVVKFNCDFFEYALNFIKENKETLDIRSYDACIKQFQQFLGKKKFSFAELSENILIKFHQYLQKKLNGITPYNYFKKLKRIIRAAVKDKFLRKDPSESIKLNKGQCKDKEVLSEIELVTLWKTN